ncbi:UDP binding domain-containing protein, partial [Bradyrhizobium oligotrophicum]
DIISELQSFGIEVQVADPLADGAAVHEEYGIGLTAVDALRPADAVVLAVSHDQFLAGGWPLVQGLLREESGLVLDVKMKLDRASKPGAIELWRP